jgi:hypothetical protein
MRKPPCFICDLDGTLCDVEHRRVWVATHPKNWDAWNAGIALDKPNFPVLSAINALAAKFDIVLVSGRGSEHRQTTITWLRENKVKFSSLHMRREGDQRNDAIVKSELADDIEKTFEIVGAFDDRKKVVDMWIKRGIFVFDVAQGKGDF